jgi:predicted metal-dependent hydrolase
MSKPDFVTHFTAGMDHFNRREFWEAHEAWETLWLAAESEVEQFLQGLIQIAAAYHHVQRGTYRGAGRLFDAALERLEPFPPAFCGVDRAAVEKASRRHRAWLTAAGGALKEPLSSTEYPILTVPHSGAIAPPSLQW